MKPLMGAFILVMSVPLASCAIPSLPLTITPATDPEAAKYNAEGIEHYNKGRWNIAKKYFEAAVKADPKSAEAHYNLALALDGLGANATADEEFKKAAELAPGNTGITESSAYRNHVRTRFDFDYGHGFGGSGEIN